MRYDAERRNEVNQSLQVGGGEVHGAVAGFGEAEAKRLFGRDPKLPPAIQAEYVSPWSATKAEKQFLARFKALLP